MKNLKFRAWDKDKDLPEEDCRMWYLIKEINFQGEQIFIGRYGNEIDCEINELMQFTGLKDKNGKEIYEGDIILDWENIDKYKVVWNKEWACFELDRLTFNNDTCQEIDDSGNCVIIGNIYENPELLGGGSA